MLKKILLSLAALLAVAAVMQAQELPYDPELRKGVLENGMTYLYPAQRKARRTGRILDSTQCRGCTGGGFAAGTRPFPRTHGFQRDQTFPR